jgi:hypothetical protein
MVQELKDGMADQLEFGSPGELSHMYVPSAQTLCIMQFLYILFDFTVFNYEKIHRKKHSDKIK